MCLMTQTITFIPPNLHFLHFISVSNFSDDGVTFATSSRLILRLQQPAKQTRRTVIALCNCTNGKGKYFMAFFCPAGFEMNSRALAYLLLAEFQMQTD